MKKKGKKKEQAKEVKRAAQMTRNCLHEQLAEQEQLEAVQALNSLASRKLT